MSQSIPATAHFLWIGPSLPWLHGLALLSSVVRGGFQEAQLHITHPLTGPTREWLDSMAPQVRLVDCDLPALMDEVAGPKLADLCRSLTSPVARSNLFRAAVVAQQGGVYLDMDTVTVASFEQLLKSENAFVGLEHVAYPYKTRRSKHPLVLGKALILDAVRGVFRHLPNGHRQFPHLAGLYPRAINGAVLGAPAKHPWLQAYLAAMTKVPAERRHKPNALGTHLLQEITESYQGLDLTVLPPPFFYPVAPEVSGHYFRKRPQLTQQDLDTVLQNQTLVAHWYGSVKTKHFVKVIDAEYVKKHATRQIISALAVEVLGEWESRQAQLNRPNSFR